MILGCARRAHVILCMMTAILYMMTCVVSSHATACIIHISMHVLMCDFLLLSGLSRGARGADSAFIFVGRCECIHSGLCVLICGV